MKRISFFILLGFLVFANLGYSQFFGKNKVQHTSFNWQFLQSEHFDIYFTDGGNDIAEFVAQVAEDSYQSIKRDFRYELVDRIKLIVYNSHNDFGQTNVDLSPPEESVGGFTEFFKNRVVIPYEGEWEKFRHVIHHELTHAIHLQMTYGAGAQSIVTGLSQLQMPLWLVEGIAEYESRGWDIESDMFMRDASVSGYLPPVDYLNGFLAYKGGQSLMNYIAERYGNEKIGELLGKVRITKNVERALKQSIGIDKEELTKRWHLYLKRKYWPDIADRKEPDEMATRLTNHRKDQNFINTSPAMSHKGDKIVYLSDREDYFDIFLASSIDGKTLKKLVRGQRAGNLEELHWLRGPAFSWSPDDKNIIFSAKSKGQDALHIVNVKSGRITNSYRLGLDAIYNPAWSPNGKEVAFMGVKHGRSGLYAYHLEDDELRKITNDIFSDVEPSWSPDGTKLVFASDRGQYLDGPPVNFSATDIEMKNYNIYEINADGTGVRVLVDTPYIERTPIYSPDGKYIAFTSDRSGVSNVYLKDLETMEEWPITNVLTGAFIPTWGGEANRLAFASFYYAGYDVYMMKNPLDVKPGDLDVQKTQYVKNFESKQEADTELYAQSQEFHDNVEQNKEWEKYRNFVFDRDFAEGTVDLNDPMDEVFLDSTDYVDESGDYKVYDYEVEFSPDIVSGNVGYDQFFGTLGYSQIMLSDVLGDHRVTIAANLFGDLKNANYAAYYYYLPNRWDIGGGFYHNAYFFWSPNLGWMRDRNFGLNMSISNPLDRYTRMSYGVSLSGISRDYMDFEDSLIDQVIEQGYLPPRQRFFMMNNLTYTKDTTVWGYTGPTNGSRYAVGLTYSPKLGESGIDFTTVRADWRSYFRLTRNYTFAFRGVGGFSGGMHPQKFFLGGVPNWINRSYSGGLRVDNVEEIYFSSFEMPLRGANYYQQDGTRFFITNIEFRFPLIHQILMGFPLPLYLSNVGGALFTDLGIAWDEGESFKVFKRSPSGFIMTKDAFASVGYGVRINLGFFLVRVDVAWPTNYHQTLSSPHVLWSLGADF